MSYTPFTPVKMGDEVKFEDLIKDNMYTVQKHLPNSNSPSKIFNFAIYNTTISREDYDRDYSRSHMAINNGMPLAVFNVNDEMHYFAQYKDFTNGGCKFFHTKRSAAEAEKLRRRKVSTELQLLSKDQFTGTLPKEVPRSEIASYLGGRTARGKKTRRHRRRSQRKTKRHSSKRKRNTKRKRTSKRRR
tara:strand:- start:40 stop:603 length:564 start_codon:yes stop_codon:yes gene_type:complete